jgi:hypothetical protein
MSGQMEHGPDMRCDGMLTKRDWRAHAQLSLGIAERAERNGDGALAAYLRDAAAKMEWRAAQTLAARGLRQ